MTQTSISGDTPFIQESETEMIRLLLVHRYLSEALGGPLPLHVSLKNVHTLLDVGCGAGGWSYEMAWLYPFRQVVGIDTSAYFIEQARTQASQWGGIGNITYHVQDMYALDEHVFSQGSFDLIHLRFLVAHLQPMRVPALLTSLRRLCRAGGSLVWTEMEFPLTNSGAFEHLMTMIVAALKVAGRAFVPGNGLGITARMNIPGISCTFVLLMILYISFFIVSISFFIFKNRNYFYEMTVGTDLLRPCGNRLCWQD